MSQDPEVWVPSLAGPRVLHETKEAAAGALGRAANTETTCVPPSSAPPRSCNSLVLVVSYTMFSAPGRGPCRGPRSCLLCNWASCRTGMLHSGHTLRTSSHLIRHLQNETPQEARCQSRVCGTTCPHTSHAEHFGNPDLGTGVNSQVLKSSTTGWRMHFILWRNQRLQFSKKLYSQHISSVIHDFLKNEVH